MHDAARDSRHDLTQEAKALLPPWWESLDRPSKDEYADLEDKK